MWSFTVPLTLPLSGCRCPAHPRAHSQASDRGCIRSKVNTRARVALVSLLHAAQRWCVQALDSERNTVDDSGNFMLCGQTIVVHDPSQKVRTLTNPQAASSVSQSESEGQTQPHTRATHTTKTNAGHAKQDSYALSYDTPSARRYAPRPGRPA